MKSREFSSFFQAETSIVDQMEAYARSAPSGGDGDYSSDDDREMQGMQTNINHLMSNPGGGEDDRVPDGRGTTSSFISWF